MRGNQAMNRLSVTEAGSNCMTYNIQYYLGHETLHPRNMEQLSKSNKKQNNKRGSVMIWQLLAVLVAVAAGYTKLRQQMMDMVF